MMFVKRIVIGSGVLLSFLMAGCRLRFANELPPGITFQATEYRFAYIDWAPDSGRLVGATPDVTPAHSFQPFQKLESSELYIWQPDLDTYERVSDEAFTVYNADPIWHPREERILYYSSEEFGEDYRIGVVDITTGMMEPVFDAGRFSDWFPEGDKIATENETIFIVDIVTKKPERIWASGPGHSIRSLAVSPNGDLIAVITKEVSEFSFALRLIDVSGNLEQTILEDSTSLNQVSWSPDGQWIILVRSPGGKSGLSAIKADGSCMTDTWTTRGTISDVSWSPDGKQIAASLLVDRTTYGVLFINTGSRFFKEWTTSGSCGS